MAEVQSFTKSWLITFYKEQLDKFTKIGIGKVTEFDVTVTKKLIDITKKRLMELGGIRALSLKISLKKPAKSRTEEERLESVERVRAFRERKRLKTLENKIHENGQVLTKDFKSINGEVRKVHSTRRHGKDKS